VRVDSDAPAVGTAKTISVRMTDEEFALIWQRLPEERREHIRQCETDWPSEANPAALAHRVWRWMASESFVWPSRNEAPF
jgi:hypothetical protein